MPTICILFAIKYLTYSSKRYYVFLLTLIHSDSYSKLPYLINSIYFWYSLLYLIGRTCVVFLCAGSIHDVSRRPLKYIQTVPTCEWCIELERFAEQVRAEKIALSGMRIFFMTRKLLFGVST